MKKLLLALALVSGFASAEQPTYHIEFDWNYVGGQDVIQGDTDNPIYNTFRISHDKMFAFKSEKPVSKATCDAIEANYGAGGDTTINYETYVKGLYMHCRPDGFIVGALSKQVSLAFIDSIMYTGKVEFQGFEFKSAYRFKLVH